MKKIMLVAFFAVLAMVQNAMAFAPSAADTTALAAVSTDLVLWFSPLIAIALTILAYFRVRKVMK